MPEKQPTDTPSAVSREEIRKWITELESDDGAARMKARAALTEAGAAAVDALTTCLYAPDQHVRWEAAKTLESIADPQAASALVHALDDDDRDVRWVAGQALVALGKGGLRRSCGA